MTAMAQSARTGAAAAPPAPRLAFDGVSMDYDGVRAVRDVTFDVQPGEVMCLLGPSGCGKSTLLRIAAGVERQSAGAVLENGVAVSDATRHDPPESRSIGLMFQDFALFPHLTVADNVTFGLKRSLNGARRRVAAAYLARVGLAGYGAKYPHQLSGGEQQRVALARAVAPRPQILLADEPTGNLDETTGAEIADLLFGLRDRHGATLVMVTHAPELARRCDRVVTMRDGRTLASDGVKAAAE